VARVQRLKVKTNSAKVRRERSRIQYAAVGRGRERWSDEKPAACEVILPRLAQIRKGVSRLRSRRTTPRDGFSVGETYSSGCTLELRAIFGGTAASCFAAPADSLSAFVWHGDRSAPVNFQGHIEGVFTMSTAVYSDEVVGNQQEIMGNQGRILANQERIAGNQTKFDKVILNQATIVANQERIVTNQNKLDRLLLNQSTIVANQERLLTNQEKLDKILANQAALLANQEQRILGNQEKIIGNQHKLLARD
jgi:hypothetical protein